MDNWDDYILEQYEIYIAENCTCASSDEDCPCMSLARFSDHHFKELEDYWAQQAYDDCVSYAEYIGALECQI